MGSVSLAIGDGTARFRRSSFLSSSLLPLLMLLSVIATNLLALYSFTRSSPNLPATSAATTGKNHHNLSVVSQEISLILREISSSQRQLAALQRDLLGIEPIDVANVSTPPELRLFLSPQPLPLGPDSKTKISHMSSSISHLCSNSIHLLHLFMSYTPFHLCPSATSNTSTSLISRFCDPLPRRRCLSRRSSSFPHLLPFPSSLWAAPSPFLDKLAFVKPRGKNDFPVDDVLALASPPGSIRTGLDLAGSGAGNLAARMAERGVTVVTLISDPKIGDAVATRGLFPLQITPGHRFPFHDGVFDLVHAVDLEDGGGFERVEFLMFDVDRVLRSGGLFWLDNYWCVDGNRKTALTSLIERFKFKKLKWVVGEKPATAGGGDGKTRVYLSAVLQKPPRG